MFLFFYLKKTTTDMPIFFAIHHNASRVQYSNNQQIGSQMLTLILRFFHNLNHSQPVARLFHTTQCTIHTEVCNKNSRSQPGELTVVSCRCNDTVDYLLVALRCDHFPISVLKAQITKAERCWIIYTVFLNIQFLDASRTGSVGSIRNYSRTCTSRCK